MSTTNPDPANPGTPHHDDHGSPSGPPDPSVIARGHEVDAYDRKSVMSVPLLVVAFFVIAFVVTSILFTIFAPSDSQNAGRLNPRRILRGSALDPNTDDPNVNPQAAKRNSPDLNTRIARTKRGGEIDQPRPEPIRERAGDSRATTSPEIPGVNSPELHPEDLVPSPEHTPALFRTGWVKPGIARITIDEAMDAMLKQKETMLPVRKVESKPIASEHLPTAANAGRGAGENKVTQPQPPPLVEGKK